MRQLRSVFVRLLLATLLLSLSVLFSHAAVDPPSLRCVEVDENGDVTIVWQLPINNFGQFREYEIYVASNPAGPFTQLTSINVWGTNFYQHVGAGMPGAGQLYYYIISRFDDGTLQSSAPSDTVSPMLVSLTKYSVDLSGQLFWNPIRDPKITTNNQNFEVYRRLRLYGNQWDSWIRIGLSDFQNRLYNDSVSICDGAVEYKIETVDQLGCRSRSNLVRDTLFDLTPPDAPIIDSVSVDNVNGQVKIAWTPSPSPDVTGYIITRGQFPNTTIVDTASGRFANAYIDDDNSLDYFSNPLFYQVAAIDSCGNVRPAPKEHGTINLQTSKDFCEREIILSWNNYDGWPSVLRYTVFVREDSGPYQLLADLDGNTRTFSHEGIDATKVYCYIVVAQSNGTSSPFYSTSNLVCASFPTIEAPQFEYIRSVSVLSDDSIRIKAFLDTSVSEKAVQYYLLGRSFDREGPFVTIDTLRLDSSVYDLTYVDGGVFADQFPYSYVIDAIDECDQVIKRSNVGRTIHIAARGSKYAFENELDWTPYVDWLDYGLGVQQYNVHLGLNDEFTGEPIGTVNPTTFKFFDAINQEVQFASKFCYYVEAIEEGPNLFNFKDTSRSNKICLSYDPDVYIPNVFTPNKDSRNEFWKPILPYINPEEYECDVYDRWGSKIFTIDEDSFEGFPGEDSNGKPYPVGVYVFHLRAFAESGSFIERKGIFYLTR